MKIILPSLMQRIPMPGRVSPLKPKQKKQNISYMLTMTLLMLVSAYTAKATTIVPGFTYTLYTNCSYFGAHISVQDTSTVSPGSDSIASIDWDFGNGQKLSNYGKYYAATMNYTTSGTYTIKEVIKTRSGAKDSVSKTISITAKPIPYSGIYIVDGCGTLSNVHMKDSIPTSNGAVIASYSWNFGDGNTSSSANPVHSYSSAPSGKSYYTVKCTMTTTMGCVVQDSFRLRYGSVISPSFSAGTASCRDTVFFDNTSTIDTALQHDTAFRVDYRYDYGGSVYPVYQNNGTSKVIYISAGTYTVTMTATASGCTQTHSASVSAGATHGSVGQFSMNDTCSSNVVNFIASEGLNFSSPVTYTWDYGDGNTDTGRNTSHTYASTATGSFTVSLTVTSGSCTYGSSQVLELLHYASASFTHTDACLYSPVAFVDNSTADSATVIPLTWNFGDSTTDTTGRDTVSHTYTHAGYYIVTHVIKTNRGICEYSVSQTIYVDANCVWPGDANASKAVDMSDLLAIGIAYGDTGHHRTDTTTTWHGAACNNWTLSFTSGVNHKHADCNGDGVIDSADMNAVVANYSQTHSKTHTTASGSPNDPALSISLSKDSAAAGDTVTAQLTLGSQSKPVNGIYGIAVNINYSTPANASLYRADFSKSWMGTSGKNMVARIADNTKNGTLDVGITRIDHTSVTGYGQIGVLSIIMPDNLAGKQEVKRVVKFEIASYKAIGTAENNIPLYPTGDSILLHQTGVKTQGISKSIILYPNPVANVLHINTNGENIQKLSITDIFGKVTFETMPGTSENLDIATAQLPSGVYIITCTSGQREWQGRFIKQ